MTKEIQPLVLGSKCVRLTLPLCNNQDLALVLQHLKSLTAKLEPLVQGKANQAVKISHARYLVHETQYLIKDGKGKVYDAV